LVKVLEDLALFLAKVQVAALVPLQARDLGHHRRAVVE